MQIALNGRVRLDAQPQTENERHDVRNLKTALNRLGFYEPAKTDGMNADLDGALLDALYAFQRNSTIALDDTIIASGSTTERILNRDLAALDENTFYIWRTVGDGKVRGEHAARNAQRFTWGDPPDGEHPGDDYNCRCWAELVNPSRHPWIEWAQTRREERAARSNVLESLAPLRGLNDDLTNVIPLDAINSTISPLDFIGVAGLAALRSAITIKSRLRDVSWIRNTPTSKIQHIYKQAKEFGVKENWNPKNGEIFKAALEKHIKSPDTKVIDGSYHTKSATHYLNPKTNLNVIKNNAGEIEGAWRVSKAQKNHLLRDGKLGGGTK